MFVDVTDLVSPQSMYHEEALFGRPAEKKWLVGVGIAMRTGLEVHLGSGVALLAGETKEEVREVVVQSLRGQYPERDGWQIDVTVVEAARLVKLATSTPPSARGYGRLNGKKP